MSFGTSYLAHPDLFPTRHSGEAWGDRTAELSLAGESYRFRGLSEAQREIATTAYIRYRDRAEPEESTGVTVRVFRVATEDFLPLSTRGWEYSLDFDYTPESVRVAGLNLMGRLDWRQGRLSAALWTATECDVFEGVFENFFRLLVAYRLLETGGVLLHSACVVLDGRAFLLLGRSGAGKSTTARLALDAGRTVLSDDINAVRSVDGDARVYALPFTGDLDRTEVGGGDHPLGGLLQLVQGDRDELQPLPSATAVALLTQCSSFLNADPHRLDLLLTRLADLATRTTTARLLFSRDGEYYQLMEKDTARWPSPGTL